MRKILISSLIVVANLFAFSGTYQGIMCIDKESIIDLIEANTEHDYASIAADMENGNCVRTEPIQVSQIHMNMESRVLVFRHKTRMYYGTVHNLTAEY